MKNPPNITAARIVGPLTVALDWRTGETLRADLTALTVSNHFLRFDENHQRASDVLLIHT